METETLFKFVEPKKNHQILTHVRRDPQFPVQLYFMQTNSLRKGELSASFLQALRDSTKNQLKSFVFFKHKFNKAQISAADSTSLRWALDEIDKRLFIMFGTNTKVFIKIYNLHFAPADASGYRHVVVEDRPDIGILEVDSSLLGSRPPPFPMLGSSITALTLCPSTGKPIVQHIVNGYRDMASYPSLAYAAAFMEYNLREKSAISEVMMDGVKFLSYSQSKDMENRCYLFSPSKDLLVLLTFHTKNSPSQSRDDYMLLYSYNPKMQLLNTLKIDPVKLVQSFLPKTSFDQTLAQVPRHIPKDVYFGANLKLLGYVHKYVVFSFNNHYIFAAKLAKNWYKLPQFPNIENSKVMCVDREKKNGEILDVSLICANLYFLVKQGDTEAVRRMSLGRKFKDYRRCAACGKEESRKRRKDGKRVSSYKVCRICKSLNFHHSSDPSKVCHYCSDECQRKHWKEHKVIHQ